MGIRVLGISCIANTAAGILSRRLSHAEVIATTDRVGESFVSLLRATVPLLPGLTRSP
jgi:purine-nucleoside phosphorylase